MPANETMSHHYFNKTSISLQIKKKKNSNHVKIKSANVSLLFETLSFLFIHFFNSFKTNVRSHHEHGFTISRLKKNLYHL